MEVATLSNVSFKKQIYGQLVVGPPGSGKSTYCQNAYKFYKQLGRDVCIVNMDPGNEIMPYEPGINIMDLISVEDVMENEKLGPNGALLFCAEFIETYFEEFLLARIQRLSASHNYFIFDCPGQVELYTHHKSMANIFKRLEQTDIHLVTVNLIDVHYCSDPGKFLATLMMSLSMMLRMELPHVNVLSKADLLKEHNDKLLFNIDFYAEVLDLNYLLEAIEDTPLLKKYKKLNAAFCSLIQDYNLVSFHLLNSSSDSSMLRLRNHIDKANGFAFRAGEEAAVNALLCVANQCETETERYTNDFESYFA